MELDGFFEIAQNELSITKVYINISFQSFVSYLFGNAKSL